MIGTSFIEYLFIRACIIGLQSVAPLSIICCLTWLFSYTALLPVPFNIPLPLKFWAVIETLFYVFVSVIYQEKLQYEALHPPAPPRKDRKELFQLCNDSISDPEAYLKKWFLGASAKEIKRENIKDFFLWAFFNRDGPPGDDDEELEGYVVATEALLGRKIEHGRGSAVCLRLTIDRADMSHRSVLWYLVSWKSKLFSSLADKSNTYQCVGFVDFLTCTRLQYYGFSFRRTVFPHFFMIFPMRPITLIRSRHSPAKRLTYWYRPHTSRTRKPVVFIHGIGVGLYPYVNFLVQLDSCLNAGRSSEDQVGIIAVEIMSVSFRITHTALRRDEMCDEIQAILRHHHLDKPIIVSHSYGTVIATHLLKSPKMANSIGPIVLIDPISILLHHPDVAYNFTRRKPRQANEHQLHYFASMDMGVSHSLSRCFFWSENVLWKHDIGNHSITVSLAERDLIVDTKAVGSYLASHNDEVASQRKGSTNDVPNGFASEKLVSQHAQSSGLGEKSNGYTNGGTVRPRFSTAVTNTPSPSQVKTRVEWRDRTWAGEGLDLLWYRTLDHAQVFDKAQSRKPLVEAIARYSVRTS